MRLILPTGEVEFHTIPKTKLASVRIFDVKRSNFPWRTITKRFPPMKLPFASLSLLPFVLLISVSAVYTYTHAATHTDKCRICVKDGILAMCPNGVIFPVSLPIVTSTSNRMATSSLHEYM